MWGVALSSKNKIPRGFLQSCEQREILLHLFSAAKSTLSGRHFRSNEELRQAVKNYLRSLGTDFYQDGFLKLISRYEKRINVGGKYEGK
ncbi:hypothetical protein AVEN_96532-1 [Araneus ventricosus]|uniref:DUF4817 domain-containing protein n=1 Tax=Araneus ventricosus TaxID=182803 RepID=A0A4Y2I426_ARAVE|nr:hypothetical protein AVEN_96532-1 [Araneus ventricosus]